MKIKHLFIVVVLTTSMVFYGCDRGSSGSSSGDWSENFDGDTSYALGMNIGYGLLESMYADGVFPDLDDFFKGMQDAMRGNQTRFDQFQAANLLDLAFSALDEELYMEAYRIENEFFIENGRRPDVYTTSSGLQYEIITETEGPKPTLDSIVRVHYEGRLISGALFDSSYEYGEPLEFGLSDVIYGWGEGLQLMSEGSQYILYIPSDLAYGASGIGPIPPFATLIFIVELIEIIQE